MKPLTDTRFRTFLREVIWPSLHGGLAGIILEFMTWMITPLVLFDYLNIFQVSNPGNNLSLFPFYIPFFIMAALRTGYRFWVIERLDP